MHAEAATIAARLVRGQAWLVESYDRLLALPDNGTREEFDRWYREFDRWDRLARDLTAYRGYVPGCIHGEGKRCPKTAVANCRSCEG